MKRIPQLDGIRGLAILSVFLHHSLHIKLMWMGVDLFFVLSGFLITGVLMSMKERTIGTYFSHFYGRRVRRILPSYALLLIIGSTCFGFAWAKDWYFYFGAMNFMTLLPVLHVPAAFGPLWSLAVEEQFYLFWPFAIFFLPRRSIAGVAVALILLAPIFRGIAHFSNIFPVYMLTPFRMDLLASGALLSIIYRTRKESIERYGLPLGTAMGVVGLGTLFYLSRSGITTYTNSRLSNVGIFECSLLIAVGLMLWALSGTMVGVLKLRPLRFVGTISYTMYLFHLIPLELLHKRFTPHMLALVSFVITFTYATLSWYLIEKPILGTGTKDQGLRPVAVPGQNPAVS